MAKRRRNKTSSTALPVESPFAGRVPEVLGPTADNETIVQILEGYRTEADMARKGGLNPRDEIWKRNINLYWNRYDFSQKKPWQAKEVMPEVPAYVDRFAAAMKEALVQTPGGFYTVSDPADRERDVTQAIKNMTDVWLSVIGQNAQGSPLAFPAVFEEQMKLGAIMAASGVVTWKNDYKQGRVAFESVDPRSVWLDHTSRSLYRIRRTEMDLHDVQRLAKQTAGGQPIYDLPEVERLLTGIYRDATAEREQLTGTGQQITSTRKPVTLDEYLATVVAPDGRILADNQLMVVANGTHLIRKPTPNPFWHKRDWLVYAPLVTVPLSPYGRSYMEDFGSVAKTFTELTNLILDAVHMSAVKAIAIVPTMLVNPAQATNGVAPGMTYQLEDGSDAKAFAQELDLGHLNGDVVTIWQAMKKELSEAAGINEIGMGQFAPNGRTSATEVMQTQQSSSAMIRSVAQTIETRFLDPTLDLVWKTGLQHSSPQDEMLAAAAGPDMYRALKANGRELAGRQVTFQARGISMMIQKSQMLQTLLQLLQVVGQNENLTAAFMQKVDITKLMDMLFYLSNIDPSKLTTSEREQLTRDAVSAPLARGGAGSPGGDAAMQQALAALGIAKG